MCCLTFENDTYKELKEKFPKIGKIVNSPGGKGKVVRHDIIGNKVGIRLEGGAEVEARLSEITEND
jgi:cell fate regulator YaaT (PSP1 superfamily)